MNATRLQKAAFSLVDRLFGKISTGHLKLTLPDGTEKHYGDDSAPAHITVHRYDFFRRLVTDGDIGLGESWTAGDWTSDELPRVLELFVQNIAALQQGGRCTDIARRVFHFIQHALNRNTRAGSRRNIHAHYDIGNDLYNTFLDTETMAYSSALFQNADEPLADAQRRKIQRLAERAAITSAHHVLEIGCGWGGFAIETARRTGCRVTGITISEEQYRYARERVAAEKLEDRVEILLCDYRDVHGSFDRIVSIEMLEAVGHQYYGTFFKTCDRLLKPDGCAVLQVITIPDQRYNAYRRKPDWMQKHIFPGGMLPSLTALTKAMTNHSTFTIEKLDHIGIHYAETLRRWRRAFEDHKQILLQRGYDESFQRKWIYYFTYCEVGFQTRLINNLHLVINKTRTTTNVRNPAEINCTAKGENRKAPRLPIPAQTS